jgi:predicted glycosyl hydrolase (DUF1957 family)
VVNDRRSGIALLYRLLRFEPGLAERFNRLCDQIDRNEIDDDWLSVLENHDNIFSASILSRA